MGNTKDRHLMFKLKEYLLFWIIFLSVSCGFGQTNEKKDVSATDYKIKPFSLGYQSALHYDPNTNIFFPFGINAEYRLGKRNSSLDVQILLYHPKATHIEQSDNYQFLTEYFIQYDLGMRFYLDNRNAENTGFYFRPSVGINTKYYRRVTHDFQQNRGLEVSRLLGKAFIGMQLGYKGKINKLIFANAGIGSLVSFFNRGDKIVILLSPNITIAIGASF